METDIDLAKKYISKSQSSEQRKIKFELTFPQYKKLMKTKKCYYTGVILNSKENDPNQRTLDRIDSSIGYTAENTVACSNIINKKKTNLTLLEMKQIFTALKNNKKL